MKSVGVRWVQRCWKKNDERGCHVTYEQGRKCREGAMCHPCEEKSNPLRIFASRKKGANYKWKHYRNCHKDLDLKVSSSEALLLIAVLTAENTMGRAQWNDEVRRAPWTGPDAINPALMKALATPTRALNRQRTCVRRHNQWIPGTIKLTQPRLAMKQVKRDQKRLWRALHCVVIDRYIGPDEWTTERYAQAPEKMP